MSELITLAHGSGGRLTHLLIRELFQRHFENKILLEGSDAAIFGVSQGKLAFTTDSYVISPIFFRNGNIGKLAVCGTVNDLAVCGAIPRYLSCGMIIEEGFPIDKLEKIVISMAETAREAKVMIVTGDTKVVPRGCVDQLFINTSGVGVIPEGITFSTQKIQPGDQVIISGTIGDHGTAILLEREDFKLQSEIVSDCAPLNGLLQMLTRDYSQAIRVMRDPTRGGVATTLNELVTEGRFGIRLFEEQLPVQDGVAGICEILGLEPLYLANEGKVLLIVAATQAQEIVAVLRQHAFGQQAAIIGEIDSTYPGKVYLKTITGGQRVLEMLVGDQLPRIC